MLTTIREYASEALSASGERDAVLERLARYLVDLANEEGAPSFLGRTAEAYARLDVEHANVRGVVEWAVARGRFDRIADLAVVLREVWTSRGNIVEVRKWAEHALRARDSIVPELWPYVLLSVGQVRLWAGDRAGARVAMEDALDAAADVYPQPFLEATCLSELSWIACEDDRVAEARALAERSLQLRLEHGMFVGRALIDLGHAALIEGELEEAHRVMEEARDFFDDIGSAYNLAYSARMLAEIARRRGDHDEAAALLDEAIRGFAALHDVSTVAACLKDLAIIAKERGEPDRAARLWSAATALAKSDRPAERVLFPHEIGELPELEDEAPEPTLEEALALATS
jgi:tetratricopeptide (TPR) repeat protein